MEKDQTNLKLHDVPGTPFQILENNLEYRIILGNELASERIFRNTKDAKRYIFSRPWDLIGVLIVKIVNTKKLHDEEIQEENDDSQNNY